MFILLQSTFESIVLCYCDECNFSKNWDSSLVNNRPYVYDRFLKCYLFALFTSSVRSWIKKQKLKNQEILWEKMAQNFHSYDDSKYFWDISRSLRNLYLSSDRRFWVIKLTRSPFLVNFLRGQALLFHICYFYSLKVFRIHYHLGQS